MDLNITVPGKGAGKKISVSDETFGKDFNEALVHQVVVAHMAGGRAGTKAQKSRADVSGGGRKPWRQKGTGRARSGTIRSPIWRTGGVAFAARPRDYSQKVNRKAYRAAMRSILSELLRQERLVVVESFELDQPKTSEASTKLKELALSNVLIVLAEENANVALATRNIPKVHCMSVNHINPVDLIAFEKVLVTVDALKMIEERLQ